MSSMDKITYKQTQNAILCVKWCDIRKNHRENLDDLVSLLVNEFVTREIYIVDQYWETRNSGCKMLKKNLDEMRKELFLNGYKSFTGRSFILLLLLVGCYYEEVFKQLNKYYNKALHK